MPFEIRNAADNTLIHQNSYTAEDFNTPKLVEGTLNINSELGTAQLKQWYFDGIRIGHSKWLYNDYLKTIWKADLDVINLQFNLKGKVSVQKLDCSEPFVMQNHEYNMFYSSDREGVSRNETLESEGFMIQFNKQAFLRLTQDANDILKRFSEAVMEGQSVALFDKNPVMDISMQNIIREIISCNYHEGLKKMFLLSKAIELLVLQAEAYYNQNKQEPAYLKTTYDKDSIIYAKEYLLNHVNNPPSLTQLAKEVGINEYKLKKGFKETFGKTVFGYLSDYRLELAKVDLLEKTKTASEIAFELGYSSLQHFSTAFKKKFGFSPSQVK